MDAGPQIIPTPVPWPYPVMVPQPAAGIGCAPGTGCALGGTATGCASCSKSSPAAAAAPPAYGSDQDPNTGRFLDRVVAAWPLITSVRDASDSVRALMPAVQTARDALARVRESFGALRPAAAEPAATPFGPAIAPLPPAEPRALCPDRTCVVYELRALNDTSGQPVRTAQVPDRTPIEILGDTTGVIALDGPMERRWSHVRLRATDGSTIEGFMKPENLVNGSPPPTGAAGDEGAATGCACAKLVGSPSVGALETATMRPGQYLRLHRREVQAAGHFVDPKAGPWPILVYRVVADRGRDGVSVDLVGTFDGSSMRPFDGGRFRFKKSTIARGMARNVGASDYYAIGTWYRSQGDLARAARWEAAGHGAYARGLA